MTDWLWFNAETIRRRRFGIATPYSDLGVDVDERKR
jgi:hypothetical protein